MVCRKPSVSVSVGTGGLESLRLGLCEHLRSIRLDERASIYVSGFCDRYHGV